MRKGDKKGELLVGNIIFIVLNLLFLTILFLFISQQGSGSILLEQSYAKQIALTFDLAKPRMTVFLDFKDGFDKIRDNVGKGFVFDNENIKDFIKIHDNIVTIQLDRDDKRKGYSYAFFNDINFNLIVDDKTEGRKGIAFNFK